MGDKLQIALPAETDSLIAIRAFVEDSCAQAGLDDETSYDIKLAVDEACMNIVEHGYAGMDPGSIIVSLQYGAHKLVVRITDFGAFLDLGGVDGLLYITDISWGRINHPSEVLSLNQKINVVVLDFDENKKRISLGLKQLQPHPWEVLSSHR